MDAKLKDLAKAGKETQNDKFRTPYQKQEDLQRYYLKEFFLGDFLGADRELIERIERENIFLWNGVLDRQIWFVSPRGDKFESKRDTGLQERGINFLTYHFDKKVCHQKKSLFSQSIQDCGFEGHSDTRPILILLYF